MKNSPGLTFIEILVVIAIIVLLSAIITPRLNIALRQDNLENDAKKLASNIGLAQQYALGQRDGYRYYGLVFYNGGYWIKPYNNPSEPENPIVVPSSINESGDILFSSGTTISGAQDIIFDFTGSALLDADIQITLTNDSNAKTITVTHLTGHVALN